MKLNEYIHYDGLGLAQLIEKRSSTNRITRTCATTLRSGQSKTECYYYSNA